MQGNSNAQSVCAPNLPLATTTGFDSGGSPHCYSLTRECLHYCTVSHYGSGSLHYSFRYFTMGPRAALDK